MLSSFYDHAFDALDEETVILITNYIKKDASRSALYLGVGSGRYLNLLFSIYKHISACDSSDEMISYAKWRYSDSIVDWQRCDAIDVKVCDNAVDIYLFTDTISYFSNKRYFDRLIEVVLNKSTVRYIYIEYADFREPVRCLGSFLELWKTGSGGVVQTNRCSTTILKSGEKLLRREELEFMRDDLSVGWHKNLLIWQEKEICEIMDKHSARMMFSHSKPSSNGPWLLTKNIYYRSI